MTVSANSHDRVGLFCVPAQQQTETELFSSGSVDVLRGRRSEQQRAFTVRELMSLTLQFVGNAVSRQVFLRLKQQHSSSHSSALMDTELIKPALP